ncbi:MAG: hypothetical protein LBT10_03410 [Methanobrevibacter sp.]|nr:hypothetical protein [Methanobrevibacter sp.]
MKKIVMGIMLISIIVLSSSVSAVSAAGDARVNHDGCWWLNFEIECFDAAGKSIGVPVSGSYCSQGYDSTTKLKAGTSYVNVYIKCKSSGSKPKNTGLLPLGVNESVELDTSGCVTGRDALVRVGQGTNGNQPIVARYHKNF